MSENEQVIQGKTKITRRDLLRKGAIVGGTLAWATPALQSLSPSAFAQAGQSPGNCAACYCWSGAKQSPSKDFCTSDGNVGFQLNNDSCRDWCKHRGIQLAPGGPFDESEYCSGTDPGSPCICNDRTDPGPNGAFC